MAGKNCDRPMHPPGAELAAQAYDAFEAWLSERGEAIGDRLIAQQAEDYSRMHREFPGEVRS